MHITVNSCSFVKLLSPKSFGDTGFESVKTCHFPDWQSIAQTHSSIQILPYSSECLSSSEIFLPSLMEV